MKNTFIQSSKFAFHSQFKHSFAIAAATFWAQTPGRLSRVPLLTLFHDLDYHKITVEFHLREFKFTEQQQGAKSGLYPRWDTVLTPQTIKKSITVRVTVKMPQNFH